MPNIPVVQAADAPRQSSFVAYDAPATYADVAPKRDTFYQALIRSCLATLGCPEREPRHIEGLLRLEYGTLDHIPAAVWLFEVRRCVALLPHMGARAEELAQSFGL